MIELKTLRRLYDTGFHLIPLNSGKKPLVTWEQYQNDKKPDWVIISGWSNEFKASIWAIICGDKNNRLIVADFDDPHIWERYFKDIKTLTVRTPSGGIHLYFKSKVIPGKVQKLYGYALDIQGAKSYVVCPGSKNEKGIWEIIQDAQILEVENALDFISKRLPVNLINKSETDIERFKKDVKKKLSISDYISRHVTKVKEGHGYWQGLCPFHSEREPSFTVYEDNFYCFGCGEHGDVIDFVMKKEGIDFKNALLKLSEIAGIKAPILKSQEKNGNSDKSESQASALIKYMESDEVELFHDEKHDPYARIRIDEKHIILSVKERGFKRWITQKYYKDTGKAAGNDAVNCALNVIEAESCFDGKEYTLHNRVCWHPANEAIWYDLGNWQAVKITAQGWEIVKNPPILFKRHKHQKPIDTSQISPSGDVKKVLGFVNIKDEKERMLFVVSLVSYFIPDIPHVILVLHGEKGASKTTMLRINKKLIDPSIIEGLSIPKDRTEFVQQLSHHYYSPYDNVTQLSDWQSDILCRAVTGEGFSKRELWTDDEDVIYSFQRCIALNGINIVATKADLLDRSVLIGLERIPKKERKSEAKLWEAFNQVRGEILSGIFTTISRAIEIYPTILLDELPRMADFTIWGCAIAEALGYGKEAFLDAYYGIPPSLAFPQYLPKYPLIFNSKQF